LKHGLSGACVQSYTLLVVSGSLSSTIVLCICILDAYDASLAMKPRVMYVTSRFDGNDSLFVDCSSYRVSSVLNRDVRQFGKKFMFDGKDETCWNSDQVAVPLL